MLDRCFPKAEEELIEAIRGIDGVYQHFDKDEVKKSGVLLRLRKGHQWLPLLLLLSLHCQDVSSLLLEWLRFHSIGLRLLITAFFDIVVRSYPSHHFGLGIRS